MSNDKFVQAYDQLMGHLYELMDDTIHNVADVMDLAKEKTSELGGLTQEEISQVSDYLMRDIEDVANSTSEVSNENSLSEWFKFDIELLENFALNAFTSLADKTRIELAKIENQAKKYHAYKSGDITGPGTFLCDKCGKQISFKSTSQLPNCPECNATAFSRC